MRIFNRKNKKVSFFHYIPVAIKSSTRTKKRGLIRRAISSGHSIDSQEHKQWINKLFENLTPCEFLTQSECFIKDIKSPKDIPGCLIDDPQKTLAIPLVEFDPTNLVNQLIEMSKEKPAERSKSVGAIVKGSGGGKTRAFEEIRRRLLLREKILVVGITFNNKWVYQSTLDDWNSVAKDLPSLSYAVSVISRMASVVFNKTFSEAVYFIKQKIDSLPEYYRLNPDILLRHFSLYVVERISFFRDVDTFIVLIDEVLRLEEGLQQNFPASKYDVTNVLRTALLDKCISTNKTINTTLAISSLSYAPIGETTSGRRSIALQLPDCLNSKDVVNEVFGLSKAINTDKLLMENVARTVDTIPRLNEFIRDYIMEQKELQQKDIPSINENFIGKLFYYCAEKIDSRYKTENIILSDKVLSAIVYGDNLELDDKDTLNAISKNVISNSLISFNRNDSIIKVQTSVMMLWRATRSDGYDNPSLPRLINSGIYEIIKKITNFQKEGYLLETVIFEWMKIRVFAAMCYNHHSPFTLARYYEDFDFIIDIVGSSYDDTKLMNDQILNIKVSKSNPIVIFRSVKNGPQGKEEAWDLALAVYNPDSEYPFYIFFDTKACKEGLSCQNISTFPNHGRQYEKTKEMMEFNINLKKSPEFMYIYFRTHSVTSFKIENENNVVMELGREDSQKFFGPSIFHLYLTLRNSMDKN